ncbi:MAG: isopeptide-forming domain-containing fimbrial protein [Coriobacteriales bacterium]|jgi:fimbrial isopeptide formation D2 family protein/LPXTG-motif cell wall-anchored protein
MDTTKTKSRISAIFSVVLSVIFVMSMMGVNAGQAYAEDGSITVSTSEGMTETHDLNAYQLFDGTFTNNTFDVTGWGSGITAANQKAFVNELKGDSTFGTGTANAFYNISTTGTNEPSASAVAGVLSANKDNATFAQRFADIAAKYVSGTTEAGTQVDLVYNEANGTYTATGVDYGYYVIKDETNTGTGGTNLEYDHISSTMLQVVGAASVTAKVKTINFGKEEQNNDNFTIDDDNIGDGVTDYGDTATYQNGDSVPFRIWVTLPTDLADYQTSNNGQGYYVSFNDTLGSGLTFDSDSVQYYVADVTTDGTPNFSTMTSLTQTAAGFATPTVSGQSVTFTASDISGIEAYYATETTVGETTTVTPKAIVITYKATLDTSAVSDTGIPNTLNVTHTSNKNGDKGTTPDDHTYTFTFEIDLTKVDANGSAITTDTAEFELHPDSNGSIDETKTAVFTVSNGTYKFVKWVDSTYTLGTGETKTISSGTNGTFNIIGLDASNGTETVYYYLKETKAPAGYNTLTNPIKFHLVASTSATNNDGIASNPKIDSLTMKIDDNGSGTAGSDVAGNTTTTTNDDGTTVTVSHATVTTNIVNKSGNLPETGGMGTTIFVICGIAIMAIAGGAYVSRRRKSADRD